MARGEIDEQTKDGKAVRTEISNASVIKLLKRMPFSVTPDGRYFVVRGRLWRCSNPELPEETRQRLVTELMKARRQKGDALRAKDHVGIEAARTDSFLLAILNLL